MDTRAKVRQFLDRIGLISEVDYAFGRLATRFKLRGSGEYVGGVRVIPLIVPVTNVDALLQTARILAATDDLTPGAGARVTYHTVPAGRRWTLVFLYHGSTVANTWAWVYDGTTYMDLNAAATAGFRANLTFHAEPGWTFGLVTTGDAGDGAIPMTLHVLEEDAF